VIADRESRVALDPRLALARKRALAWPGHARDVALPQCFDAGYGGPD